MTKDDRLLDGLWAADAAPVNDSSFVLATLSRAARRQFLGEIVELTALTLLIGGLLWILAPTLTPLARDMAAVLAIPGVGLTRGLLAVAGVVNATLEGRLLSDPVY